MGDLKKDDVLTKEEFKKHGFEYAEKFGVGLCVYQ